MLPFEFWELSDRLLTNEANAAGFRSVVSRSYYSAFHSALDFISRAGIVIPRTVRRAEYHKLLPDLLNNSSDADIQVAGTMLGNLRDERNRADYELQDGSVETLAYAQLRHNEAATIIAKLNSCRRTKGTSGGRFEMVVTAIRQRADLLFLGTTSPSAPSTSPPNTGS